MARILFIEDSESWQNTVQKLLETAGHEFRRATTFESAIGTLGSKVDFDVIVFDLRLGEELPANDPYTWLDALIQGLTSRKLGIPPIIIVTGIGVTKSQVVQAFTDYREYVFDFFEKTDFDPKEFLKSIKDAVEYTPSGRGRPRSFLRALGYTLFLAVVVLSIIFVLLWSVNQITDPKTQQTFLQVGGALVVVIVIFVATFVQNAKIEDIVGSITKVWHR